MPKKRGDQILNLALAALVILGLGGILSSFYPSESELSDDQSQTAHSDIERANRVLFKAEIKKIGRQMEAEQLKEFIESYDNGMDTPLDPKKKEDFGQLKSSEAVNYERNLSQNSASEKKASSAESKKGVKLENAKDEDF